ncbi:hypothetical protein [Bacillus sp. FJAT-52991]|uniref:Uncharacterized protein n=1 Tax=Bacillus kandeliae TaxID=3129297 RepID=A0ABZ2NB53_9BACI
MNKFLTVAQAKQKIDSLQQYVNLVESYKTDTLEKLVIKEYAYTGSVVKVAEKLNELGHEVEPKDISFILKAKPIDELHKIVRIGHVKRSKTIR